MKRFFYYSLLPYSVKAVSSRQISFNIRSGFFQLPSEFTSSPGWLNLTTRVKKSNHLGEQP